MERMRKALSSLHAMPGRYIGRPSIEHYLSTPIAYVVAFWSFLNCPVDTGILKIINTLSSSLPGA